MKKLLCLVIFLATLCCFTFAGCEEEREYHPYLDYGINFTAEKPVFYFESVTREDLKDVKVERMRWTFAGYEPLNYFKTYEKFSENYLKNLSGNKFYLLKCEENNTIFTNTSQQYFIIYQKKDLSELMLVEEYSIVDEELGAGGDGTTVSFQILINPIEKTEEIEFTFEFGCKHRMDGQIFKYINIYAGEECFSTCYFNNRVSIPSEWFEDYLKTNLIYGDDL